MDYDKALATLRYVQEALEQYFSKEGDTTWKKKDA